MIINTVYPANTDMHMSGFEFWFYQIQLLHENTSVEIRKIDFLFGEYLKIMFE